MPKINMQKHYKIWFSNNKDDFMPFINRQRLMRMRVANPGIDLSLIYSSSLISEVEERKLKKFCENNRIKAVDFDKSKEMLCLQYPNIS